MSLTRTGLLAGLGFLVLLTILAVPALTAERPTPREDSDESAVTALDFAFEDINPQAPTHVLVIPREHIASLDVQHGDYLVGGPSEPWFHVGTELIICTP